MKERDTWFKARFNWAEIFTDLSDQDLRLLVLTIWEFAQTGSEPEQLPSQLKLAWRLIKGELTQDSFFRECGRLGGIPHHKKDTSTGVQPPFNGGSIERTEQTEETITEKKEQTEETITDHIRRDLLKSGFSVDEINSALSGIRDWSSIENPTGYVLRIIQNQRKTPGKIVSAQRYGQRSYDDEDKAIWERQLAAIEAMEKEKEAQ